MFCALSDCFVLILLLSTVFEASKACTTDPQALKNFDQFISNANSLRDNIKFYLWEDHPDFYYKCQTIWTNYFSHTLSKHPQRTMDISKATFLLIDLETMMEMNWPTYGILGKTRNLIRYDPNFCVGYDWKKWFQKLQPYVITLINEQLKRNPNLYALLSSFNLNWRNLKVNVGKENENMFVSFDKNILHRIYQFSEVTNARVYDEIQFYKEKGMENVHFRQYDIGFPPPTKLEFAAPDYSYAKVSSLSWTIHRPFSSGYRSENCSMTSSSP